MSPAPRAYDESLLQAASAPTKGQIQEGYNTDLLNPPPPPPPGPRAPSVGHEYQKEYHSVSPPTHGRVPFWRTRKGLAVIAVLVVVVLGAIIGGAVGGTVGKRNNNAFAIPSNSTESVAFPNPGTATSSPFSSSSSSTVGQHTGAGGQATDSSSSSSINGPTAAPDATATAIIGGGGNGNGNGGGGTGPVTGL